MGDSVKNIIQTLVYADIFDFPLTRLELWHFLISKQPVTKDTFNASLLSLKEKIIYKSSFYCLPKRQKIITERKKRMVYSKEKLFLTKQMVKLLSIIPTIKLIGISGGLALENVDENDDIDFFIITKANQLWITRFLSLVLLELSGKRRKRNDKEEKNKICLNMFLDESNLELPLAMQNLYTAHEVIQMKPLFEKDNTYQKFLVANNWVKEFLPNAIARIRNKELGIKQRRKNFSFFISHLSFAFFEFFAKKVQLWYMQRHRTREVISDTMLAFHPKDYATIILKEYQKRIKRYERI